MLSQRPSTQKVFTPPSHCTVKALCSEGYVRLLSTSSFETSSISTPPQEDVTPNDSHSELFKKTAAIKIQKNWQKYKNRTTQKSSDSSLPRNNMIRQITSHMETFATRIQRSTTATFINNGFRYNRTLRDDVDGLDSIYEISDGNIGVILNCCVINKVAPCRELAQILYLVLKNDENLPIEFRSNLQVKQLAPPNNHVMLQSGNIIIDPWIKYLDLKATSGFRKNAVLGINRTRGFIGTTKEYSEFLNMHKDGRFVRVDLTENDIQSFDEANIELADLKYEKSFRELIANLKKQSKPYSQSLKYSRRI